MTLSTPQPVQAVGKKVEVVEFFAYHCPACYALEPGLNEWVKKKGDKINFRRIHLPFQGAADPEAHLFLTLEAMGKEAEMHPKILNAVHVQRIRLMTDAQIIDWVAKNGIDKAKFMETWNSFGVMTKLRRQQQDDHQLPGERHPDPDRRRQVPDLAGPGGREAEDPGS